jgi:predicted ArsR family transcriptional regulator
MAKLTDTQLVILSAAAERANGAVLPLPKVLKIKGAAVTKTLEGLREKGLFEERPASREAAAWREGKAGQSLMLVITASGRRAVDGGANGKTDRKPAAKMRQAEKRRGGTVGKPASAKSKSKPSLPTVRPETKQSLLIDLLKRKSGATIDEMGAATGWQPHSVRGAISGALKKKLGLTVASELIGARGRVYRIVERG